MPTQESCSTGAAKSAARSSVQGPWYQLPRGISQGPWLERRNVSGPAGVLEHVAVASNPTSAAWTWLTALVPGRWQEVAGAVTALGSTAQRPGPLCPSLELAGPHMQVRQAAHALGRHSCSTFCLLAAQPKPLLQSFRCARQQCNTHAGASLD